MYGTAYSTDLKQQQERISKFPYCIKFQGLKPKSYLNCCWCREGFALARIHRISCCVRINSTMQLITNKCIQAWNGI